MLRFSVIPVVFSVALMLPNTLNSAELNIYDLPFAKSILETHAPRFEKATGHKINTRVINFPLGENTELAFLYDEPIDVIVMVSSSVYRIAQAGWIEELSGYDEIVNAVGKMYKNVAKAVKYKDKIYGIGQVFTGVAVPLVDMAQYQALGLSRKDLPTDWDALSQQIVDIAAKGEKEFYLPYWFNSDIGVPLAFTAEVLNRGGTVVDPDSLSVSMKTNGGPAYDTLEDWRRIMLSGAVDKKVFEMSPPAFDAAIVESRHLISVHKTSAFMMMKELKKLQNKMTLLPRHKQSWGTVGALHFGISFREDDTEEMEKAKRELLIMNTRGTGDFEFSVSRDWLKERGYFSVFRDFMESEDAQAIMKSKLHYPGDTDVLMDVMANLPYPVGEWKVLWKHEFFDYMKEQLQLYLRDSSISPNTVIANLNKKIMALRLSYGYGH